MKTRTYILDGIKVVEDIIPKMYVVVDEYTPSHTITPWDYYGLRHYRPILRKLLSNGIDAQVCETRQTKMSPTGTGPGGSVRFGDNMMPSTYRVVVPKYDDVKAEQLIAELNQDIHDWIHEGKPMPVECK